MRVWLKKKLKVYILLIVVLIFYMLFYGKSSLETHKTDQNGRQIKLQKSAIDIQKLNANLSQSTIASLQREQRSARRSQPAVKKQLLLNNSFRDLTQLSDVFISVKTTVKNHDSRLKLLLDTWINTALNQARYKEQEAPGERPSFKLRITYIFTDDDDINLKKRLPAHHVFNTNCSKDHYRRSLVCKMAHEFDMFILSGKRWFCHVDDDTYLNVRQLVALLQLYNHTTDWYLGRPSLGHPMEVMDRSRPGQNIAFWFATGGAGFCISKSLALKMVPYAGGGRLMRAGEHIRLPDDCTIGYVINSLLKKDLTVIKKFHSHLEALWLVGPAEIKDQITLSYLNKPERTNIVNVPGFTEENMVYTLFHLSNKKRMFGKDKLIGTKENNEPKGPMTPGGTFNPKDAQSQNTLRSLSVTAR